MPRGEAGRRGDGDGMTAARPVQRHRPTDEVGDAPGPGLLATAPAQVAPPPPRGPHPPASLAWQTADVDFAASYAYESGHASLDF
jgi:hypothetical protein